MVFLLGGRALWAGEAGPEPGEPPSESLSDPDETFVELELFGLPLEIVPELRLSFVSPKFRVRDGEPGVPGSSFRSNEFDVDDGDPGVGLKLSFALPDDRIVFDVCGVTVSDTAYTFEQGYFGGGFVPPLTRTSMDADYLEAGITYRHTFGLWNGLDLDVGIGARYVWFDLEMDIGETTLRIVYPEPVAALQYRPLSWLELFVELRGFYMTFRVGDTEITRSLGLRGGVTLDRGRAFVRLDGGFFQPEIEERPGRTNEDIVHLRVRDVSLAVGVRF